MLGSLTVGEEVGRREKLGLDASAVSGVVGFTGTATAGKGARVSGIFRTGGKGLQPHCYGCPVSCGHGHHCGHEIRVVYTAFPAATGSLGLLAQPGSQALPPLFPWFHFFVFHSTHL